MLSLESVINTHISFKERFSDSNFLPLSQIGNIGFATCGICYMRVSYLHTSFVI